jgi:hypothetical protein
MLSRLLKIESLINLLYLYPFCFVDEAEASKFLFLHHKSFILYRRLICGCCLSYEEVSIDGGEKGSKYR